MWYHLEAYPIDEFGERVEDFELICNATKLRSSEQAARNDLVGFIKELSPDFDDYKINLISVDKSSVQQVVEHLR